MVFLTSELLLIGSGVASVQNLCGHNMPNMGLKLIVTLASCKLAI